jgi:hypothetical protein
VVVVDDLDERLDLGALLLPGLGHAAGDLARVPLDAGNQGVAVGVSLATGVDGLDDDNLERRSQYSVSLLCPARDFRLSSSLPRPPSLPVSFHFNHSRCLARPRPRGPHPRYPAVLTGGETEIRCRWRTFLPA